MKIAVVAPTHLPARRANTIQVMKMAQALTSLGHTVRLAVPANVPNGVLYRLRRFPVGGMAHPVVNWEALAHHYGLQHQFLVDWLPAAPRWRRFDFAFHAVRWAQRWGAELVYTRLPQAAALASLWGLATILEVHDLPQGFLGPWMFRIFIKGPGARRLVVITRALATDLAQKFAVPTTPSFTIIAPDGVDLSRYADLPKPLEARRMYPFARALQLVKSIPERFTAGYTGHLYPGRGVDLLLGVAARLPEVNFLLVGGEPSDVNLLQERVNAESLENVILTGFVPNADLPLYQAACEVLLMPYQRRVAASSGGDIARYLSPMKLFEYLACGRAILSSDLPVFREILSPDIAVLLPPEDVDAWAAALRNLQNDSEYRARLGENARQAASQYTWEERAARIIK